MMLLHALGISFLLTLLAEGAIALLMKKRGVALIVVFAANLLTNPPLVFLANVLSFSPVWFWLAEGVVVLIEGGIYWLFKEEFKRPILFSLICNLLSCAVGILLNGGIL